MNTTKGKSVPEALRMIAGWLEEGREIEERNNGKEWKTNDDKSCSSYFKNTSRKGIAENGGIYIHLGFEYRAKPKKPRISSCCGAYDMYRSIELTPEVIAACKAAGIEVGE